MIIRHAVVSAYHKEIMDIEHMYLFYEPYYFA